MHAAKEAIRALIDRIVLRPSDNSVRGMLIDLHGALASLLRMGCGLPVVSDVTGFNDVQEPGGRAGQNGPDGSAASKGDFQVIDIVGELVLVAGAGFEPAAFRL